ncbi:MAG: LL-diaminopimelate aminotransferase [Christensenellaceae bacterium]|jgi:LL-diaminopimelate aminotransferase|nr:LL-diaminopimelate aminotransferase [Christensenellaceae bacterium]MBS6564291.1 LL-diaminopimelate aminotransferase [Clostridiales bacterium]PWL97090.1 MAG: LL-diaminopimelate aminotransferase [Selenomonadales bacterium]
MKINKHYLDVKDSYLFAETGRKIAEYKSAHPDANVIKLSIGDVTRPLCPAVIEALSQAVEDMGRKETFHGYGPDAQAYGYEFLKSGIKDYYSRRGVILADAEIFISDGAKSDLGNILDLFERSNAALIPDPVYPAYVDVNIMDGRKVNYIDANGQNGFLPLPDQSIDADIIYLCSPNNPTGAVYNHEQLKAWVDYALSRDAIILFDAAYEAFVEGDLPRSIYEIEGARKCAIEICSLSKTAGFTGTRCGYTIIPLELKREGVSINKLWLRRQTTKFNGVSYIVQKGAAAVFSAQGQRQIAENISYYKQNARIIADCLRSKNIWFTGGENSPYIWMRCPNNMGSWEFFDYLLENAQIAGTPGEGFGKNGEGYFRLTAFGSHESTLEAAERLKKLL